MQRIAPDIDTAQVIAELLWQLLAGGQTWGSVCIYLCGWRRRVGVVQSAEAEIGQIVSVRFRGFACPLMALTHTAFSSFFASWYLLDLSGTFHYITFHYVNLHLALVSNQYFSNSHFEVADFKTLSCHSFPFPKRSIGHTVTSCILPYLSTGMKLSRSRKSATSC